MPFYTGKSADGSDMKEVMGAFVSPDGKEWSNMPYTEEDRIYEKIFNHINGIRTFRDEYNLILAKKSTLPRKCRDYLVKMIESEKTT